MNFMKAFPPGARNRQKKSPGSPCLEFWYLSRAERVPAYSRPTIGVPSLNFERSDTAFHLRPGDFALRFYLTPFFLNFECRSLEPSSLVFRRCHPVNISPSNVSVAL